MMDPSVKLSVVIPTCNRREILAKTLATVIGQEFPNDEREIVVVVDGSTDGTVEYLRTVRAPCKFTIIEQPNCGPANARNTGARASAGELILFLDDDIFCPPALLAKHAALHAGVPEAVVFGPVLVAPDSPSNSASYRVRLWYEKYAKRLAREGKPRSKFDVWVTNCSLRRTLFLNFGGYDETFRWAAEDADLAIRLWDAGVPFKFEPSAPVYQFYDKLPAQVVSVDAPRTARSELLLCRKHPSYRAHSGLGSLNTSGMRLAFARQIARSPISPEPLLRPPFWIAERLRGLPPMRWLAAQLLRTRVQMRILEAAFDELGSWQEYIRQFGARLLVLRYHDVGQPNGGDAVATIDPDSFERQVNQLASRGYQGIGLSDWLAWCREGRELNEKAVMVTFDGGYAGVARYALPILERHGFRSLVFVAENAVARNGRSARQTSKASPALMSVDEIRAWASRGVEFGCYLKPHRAVSVSSRAEFQREVNCARDTLSEILGEIPRASACSDDALPNAHIECIRAAFEVAFTNVRGPNTILTDPHQLHRYNFKHAWKSNGIPLA